VDKENLPKIVDEGDEVHIDLFLVDDIDNPKFYYGDLWFDFDGEIDKLDDTKRSGKILTILNI